MSSIEFYSVCDRVISLSLSSSSCFPFILLAKEEFLKDVMQFLILRGHNRLIPQGGLAEFPDAILNAKRLDLFNLYREVRLLFIMLYEEAELLLLAKFDDYLL